MTGKKMNSILMVDDEEIVRFALIGKLRENGFNVREAYGRLKEVDAMKTSFLSSI